MKRLFILAVLILICFSLHAETKEKYKHQAYQSIITCPRCGSINVQVIPGRPWLHEHDLLFRKKNDFSNEQTVTYECLRCGKSWRIKPRPKERIVYETLIYSSRAHSYLFFSTCGD